MAELAAFVRFDRFWPEGNEERLTSSLVDMKRTSFSSIILLNPVNPSSPPWELYSYVIDTA